MLDWIPLLMDTNYNMILFNYNNDSIYNNRIALMAQDNHGRCGYYIISEEISVNDILNSLIKLVEVSKILSEDKYYDHDDNYILQLTHTMNMRTYFG